MIGVSVDVRGLPEVKRALGRFEGPAAKRLLQQATVAGAKAVKPHVAGAAPRGATGKLKRSISARTAKRERPAAVVTARPKVAYYRHMVIGGTKTHGPRRAAFLSFVPGHNAYESGSYRSASGPNVVRARMVRGTSPRPFMSEGIRAGQGAMYRAIDQVIEKALAGV